MFIQTRIIAAAAFLGFIYSPHAFCQDAPKLRTLEGRQNIAQPDRHEPSTSTTSSMQKKAPEVKAVPVVLPVSDITLPAPQKASKSVKRELAGRVGGELKSQALKNTVTGIRIVDLDTGDVVYEHSAETLLKPASNTKLVTTAAALSILGPEYQFETELLVQGKVKDGVIEGDLQLYIDHDFTWSTRFYRTGDEPLRGLIQQLKASGIKKVNGNIIVSGYVVYGGNPTNTLHSGVYLSRVGRVFAELLSHSKIGFKKLSIQQTAARKGTPTAKWLSPILSEAIVPLNRSSHNEYADMLMMALGSKDSGKSTYAAGVKAVNAWLKTHKLDVKGFSMHDGSGLSHDNRMSASFFTNLIGFMLKSPYGREWAASLSISGYDGTYGGRLSTDDANGRVYAKSGTLRDTISGSGFFVNKYDGHTYAFSILVNGMRNRKLTRQAIDRIVRIFLKNHLDASPPSPPRFTSYRLEGDGRVMARWTAVSGAAGYRIYQSTDGSTWSKAAETKDTALVMPNSYADLRVTAVKTDGSESMPSLIFSYRPGSKVMTVIETAQCRSDEAMRPANHIMAHERPFSMMTGKDWGIETISAPNEMPSDLLLYHSTVCGGKADLGKIKIPQDIPVVYNVVDTSALSDTHGGCSPETGKVMGCFAEPVITKDRRIGEGKQNLRLRKAAGSASSRPVAISSWKSAVPLITMDGKSIAMRSPTSQEGSAAVIGFDIQGLDSKRSLSAVWEMLTEPVKHK